MPSCSAAGAGAPLFPTSGLNTGPSGFLGAQRPAPGLWTCQPHNHVASSLLKLSLFPGALRQRPVAAVTEDHKVAGLKQHKYGRLGGLRLRS